MLIVGTASLADHRGVVGTRMPSCVACDASFLATGFLYISRSTLLFLFSNFYEQHFTSKTTGKSNLVHFGYGQLVIEYMSDELT